jgi:prephenate dehydrogenase
MKRWNTVAIVGVGLIGGSIGLALRKRGLAGRVIGIGRRTASLQKAKRRETVDTTTTNVERGVAEADVVVVCTPVSTIVDVVECAAEHSPESSVITDAGSTKGRIVERIEKSCAASLAFVGSHPLAGGEKHGPEHAREDLLDGRLVIVTPTDHTPAAALKTVETFWKSLGARVLRMSPQDHDAAVAEISHLPHLVASALAAMTAEEHLPLAASGWRDTTRVAAGDVELWEQIIDENRGHVLKSLDKFAKVLVELRAAVKSGDQARLVEILQAGKRARDAVGS